MPRSRLEVKARRSPSGDITLTVRNTSGKIAFFNQIQLLLEGEPIHGSLYSDNFFTLLPREEKTVYLRADTSKDAPVTVRVRGFNTEAVEILPVPVP